MHHKTTNLNRKHTCSVNNLLYRFTSAYLSYALLLNIEAVQINKQNKQNRFQAQATSDDKPHWLRRPVAPTNGVDPSRFLGDGLAFKAKLIGLEEVPESRGEKMCTVSMAKLKAVVLAMKEHKPPITVNVALDGLRIIDEKTQVRKGILYIYLSSFVCLSVRSSVRPSVRPSGTLGRHARACPKGMLGHAWPQAADAAAGRRRGRRPSARGCWRGGGGEGGVHPPPKKISNFFFRQKIS